MNPPIKVDVTTDNLHKCALHVSDASGAKVSLEVPSHGNVYQGLIAVKEGLARVFNDTLAAHGIFPPEPDEEIPPPIDNSELAADIAELQKRKDAIDAHRASIAERLELEAQKRALEDELDLGAETDPEATPDAPPVEDETLKLSQ